jgi:hypothetical protein
MEYKHSISFHSTGMMGCFEYHVFVIVVSLLQSAVGIFIKRNPSSILLKEPP